MCARLDDFLNAFAKLRTDGSKKHWTGFSYYRSPNKPLLLLAVLDFIESGIIVRNFVEPSFELAETFQNYCALFLPPERKVSMSYPFYHMESATFWNLRPQSGQQHQKGLAISSVKRLRQLYLGAQFSSSLYPLLQMPGHMLTLSDRPMFRPPESRFWPDQDNLAWHRRERFTKM